MKKRSAGIRAALLAGVCVLAAACTSSASSGEGKPSSGGTFTYLWGSDAPDLFPDTAFGPRFNPGSPERVAVYDGLVVLDQLGKVQYRLAQSLTTTDNKTWTLKLRPNLKFSDGTPLDAAAVKYNWDRILNPATQSPSVAAASTIASTSVVDPQSLSMTLKTSNAQFPAFLAIQSLSFIASPTALETAGAATSDKGSFGQHPVGAGPYKVESWTHNSQLVLVKNPNYYGKANLDKIIIKVVPDESQRVNTLKTGGGQASYTQDWSVIAQAKAGGLQASYPATAGGIVLLFNNKKAPFDKVDARKAVAEALDLKAWNEAVFDGKAATVANLSPDESSPYFDKAAVQVSANRQDAQALFDKLAAAGTPVDFTLIAPNHSPFDNGAQWIQSQLSSFKNVKVKLNIAPPSVSTGPVLKHEYQATFAGVTWSNPYPLLTSAVTTGSPQNLSQYSNPQLDAAVDEAIKTTDAAAQKAAYDTVQNIIVADVPIYFLHRLAVSALYDKNVAGPIPTIGNGVLDWRSIQLRN